jgi:beta-lactamase class A
MNTLNPSGWVRPQPYYLYGSRSKRNYRARYGALLILPIMGVFAFQALIPVITASKASIVKPSVALTKAVPVSQPIQPAPAVVTPLDSSTALQNVLDAWATNHAEHKWSVSVQGLDGDKRHASVNKDTIFSTASVFKLLLMPKLFANYSLDSLDTKTVTVDGRGDTSLKTCVELMLKVSDNPCGEAVGNLLGWSRSNLIVHQLGLGHTNLNNPSGPTSSAGDLTLFLTKLQGGQLFDAITTSYLLGLMQHQVLRAGIPAGCVSCTVADKTGDLGDVRHDAAIVTYPGGQYVLSIFTDGASYGQMAQLTSQIQAVMSTR